MEGRKDIKTTKKNERKQLFLELCDVSSASARMRSLNVIASNGLHQKQGLKVNVQSGYEFQKYAASFDHNLGTFNTAVLCFSRPAWQLLHIYTEEGEKK